MLWLVVLAVNTAWTLADVRLGNSPVERDKTDQWTSGLYQIDPNAPSYVSGPLRSWSVYVSGKGDFAFLVLRRKSAGSSSYVITFSDHVVFTDRHVGEVFTKNCSEPCTDIQKGDTLGFYFGSLGVIPYDEKSSCLQDGYFKYAKKASSYNFREGASHSFSAAPIGWGRCRIYSLQAHVAIAFMQELSSNGDVYNIRHQRFGRIKSHRSSTYGVMQRSIVGIVAPSSNMRIKLHFVGPVRMFRSGGRREPNSCLDSRNDWLDVYEYAANGTKVQLLPRICGNWVNYDIPVIKDIFSTTDTVYIRFLSLSTRRKPGTGFNVDFVTFYPSLSKVPIYLMETCIPGKQQTVFMRRTSNNASRTVQTTRNFPLSPSSRTLGKLDCTILVKGVTGKEEFGLLFTWFQLPYTYGKCGKKEPYLKVYSAKNRNSQRSSYTLRLTECGKRNSFVFTTKDPELEIIIRGGLGMGVAFDIYTSYQYLRDKYGQIATVHDQEDHTGGFNISYLGSVVFFIVLTIICYKRFRGNIRNSRRSDGFCGCVCAVVVGICDGISDAVSRCYNCTSTHFRDAFNHITGTSGAGQRVAPAVAVVGATSGQSASSAPGSTAHAQIVDPHASPPVYDSLPPAPSPVASVSPCDVTIPEDLASPPVYDSLERLPTPTAPPGNGMPNYGELPSYDDAVSMPVYNLPSPTSDVTRQESTT